MIDKTKNASNYWIETIIIWLALENKYILDLF